jgi:hypothetical protein
MSFKVVSILLSIVNLVYYLEYWVVCFDVCHSCVSCFCCLYKYDTFLMCSNGFLPVLTTFIVSVIVPYAWPVFNMCFEYPDLLQLLLIDLICSLYLGLNGLQV